MERFWAWIGTHTAPLAVLMTAFGLIVAVAGVVVAAIYARLTQRLAAAARRQADLTRTLFEVGHRPWLYISAKYDRRSRVLEDYPGSNDIEEIRDQDFAVALENKGSVPAIITAWKVVVQRDPDEPRVVTSEPAVEVAVYPEGTESLRKINIQDRWKRVKHLQEDGGVVDKGGEDKRDMATSPVSLKARVTYKGVTDKVYVTEATYTVGAETDFALVCREVRLH